MEFADGTGTPHFYDPEAEIIAADDSGANAPFLDRGTCAAQVGRRRPPARSLRLGERAIPTFYELGDHMGRYRATVQ